MPIDGRPPLGPSKRFNPNVNIFPNTTPGQLRFRLPQTPQPEASKIHASRASSPNHSPAIYPTSAHQVTPSPAAYLTSQNSDSTTWNAPLWPPNAVFQTPAEPTPSRSPRGIKRKNGATAAQDAHISVLRATDESTETARKRRKTLDQPRSPAAALSAIYEAASSANCTLNDMLYNLFNEELLNTPNGISGNAETQWLSHFFRGSGQHSFGETLYCMLHHSYGRPTQASKGTTEWDLSPDAWKSAKNIRTSIKSFAAHIVCEEVEHEVHRITKPGTVLTTAGLRSKRCRSTPHPVGGLTWDDIGAETFGTVEKAIKTAQPLLFKICRRAATPRLRSTRDERTVRPIDQVCVNVISTIDFSHSEQANALPLALGLFLFGTGTSFDVFAYFSHVGMTPAYNTVVERLHALSDHEMALSKQYGADHSRPVSIVIDNVQNYHKQRDLRLGRKNKMNLGIAGTHLELNGSGGRHGLLVEAKRSVLKKNLRSKLTVQQLFDFIDQEHIEMVTELHWLRVLAKYVPRLESLRLTEHVSMLFRTRCAKMRTAEEKTRVHPLAACSKNETVLKELKDALFDFSDQMGITKESQTSNGQMILVHGDGLTFELILRMQRFLDADANAYDSVKFIQPVLALWHTEWTNINRIYSKYWGPKLNADPSTLGYSAAKINRPPPANLKKVEYFPYSELLYLIMELRMLDCWRVILKVDNLLEYFATLEDDKLPTLEELEGLARKISRKYSSTGGIYWSLGTNGNFDPEAETAIPVGSPWDPSSVEAVSDVVENSFDSVDTNDSHPEDIRDGETEEVPPDDRAAKPHDSQPLGDVVLANSIGLLRDSILSFELTYAIAQGDIGRAYEVLKYMLFLFAGSSHKKYAVYLLEQVVLIELETTPEMRETILASMLVKVNGEVACAVDFFQEYVNRMLQEMVTRKGRDYGDPYIRQIISRSLLKLTEMKKSFGRDGIGLAGRSGKHPTPHLRPEVAILLAEYKRTELHSYRAGRQIIPRTIHDIDDLTAGIEYLDKAKLAAWIKETAPP